MADVAPTLVEDLFRREFSHLVAALTRVLGPSNLALVEDAVQDALLSAMHAWQFEPPRDPKAWILRTARNRAIDLIRRDRRLVALPEEIDAESSALSPAEDTANQLAMMFSICDEALSQETHVTMILRLLCGLSPAEIARAYLVDTQTIDRRLHRGRTRLNELGHLRDASAPEDRARATPLKSFPRAGRWTSKARRAAGRSCRRREHRSAPTSGRGSARRYTTPSGLAADGPVFSSRSPAPEPRLASKRWMPPTRRIRPPQFPPRLTREFRFHPALQP